MIAALIFWLIKTYIKPNWNSVKLQMVFERLTRRKPGKAFIILLPLFLSLDLRPQEITREYLVIYKGDQVGKMKLYQNKGANSTYVKIVSSVQMRLVIGVTVLTDEESVFTNGRLVYSKLTRNVNGREKTNKQTRASGNIYQTSSDGKNKESQNLPIDYNLHLLYSSEPENISKVYSDNFQQFLPIQKVAEHRYKIVLPDGNFNYYSFSNGICNKVEVHHSLYTIEIKLKE